MRTIQCTENGSACKFSLKVNASLDAQEEKSRHCDGPFTFIYLICWLRGQDLNL